MKTAQAKQMNRQQVLRQKLQEVVGAGFKRDDLKIETLADSLDQVVSSTDRDIAIVRFDGNTRLLREIKAALQRLKGGTYGVCQDCEEPIPARRLDAVPWARLCLNCQSHAEDRRATEAASLGEVA